MTRPTTRPTNEGEAREAWGRHFCRRCADRDVWREASERRSMGIFAGTYCGPCWAADGRNHDRAFDPMDAGEAYDAEGY